jgi:hypothetical protein
MSEYEVKLYYTGYVTRIVIAGNGEEAIRKARDEQDAPTKLTTFIKNFEPILETLEPWKDCDTATLKI